MSDTPGYSNIVQVSTLSDDMVRFAFCYQEGDRIATVAAIAMTPEKTKRLHQVLGQLLEDYEANRGPIGNGQNLVQVPKMGPAS